MREYVKIKLKESGVFRKAEPKDIIEGKTVFLVGDEDILYRLVIEEVLRPDDQWKAFSADDGCRYGLEDLWVVTTPNDSTGMIQELEDALGKVILAVSKYI